MVKEQLEGDHARTVLMFNPWMFAGQSQLINAFFEQVAGQLRLKGKAEQALADRLIGYGQALSPLLFVPVAGAWLGRAGAVANAIGGARSAGKQPDPVEKQRKAIEAALSKLTEPIFVFIDDIDRLTAREIRDMLGLVRLTAHFPKIIYLLAFDRAKVERALDQDGLEGGRNYLDKIVELSFDLPATSPQALGNLLIEGIDQAISGIQTGPFNSGRWQDVAARVLGPLLTTPRDINRYHLAALPASLRMIGEAALIVRARYAAYGAGVQIHVENLAGRERGGTEARWNELIPAYQDLAANVGWDGSRQSLAGQGVVACEACALVEPAGSCLVAAPPFEPARGVAAAEFLPVRRQQAQLTRELLAAAEAAGRQRLAANHRKVLISLDKITASLEALRPAQAGDA